MKVNWSLDWVKLQTELSYQKVAPIVTYQDIAISILLDVTSKNQRVIDSVNFTEITETYVASVGKNLLDEITLSDSVVKYIIRDYFGDTVSLSDVLSTFSEFLRDRFEEIRVSDLESDAVLNVSLINGFLLNNPIITASPVTITPTKTDEIDLTTISEVLTAVTNKLPSDTANISDGIANNISKYLASGLSLDDFADINKSVNGVKGNIAVMSDTISVSLILSRLLGSTTLNEITLN